MIVKTRDLLLEWTTTFKKIASKTRLWAHGARSFRSGNCVCRSEQVDARVDRGFVVKALAWIITRYKV